MADATAVGSQNETQAQEQAQTQTQNPGWRGRRRGRGGGRGNRGNSRPSQDRGSTGNGQEGGTDGTNVAADSGPDRSLRGWGGNWRGPRGGGGGAREAGSWRGRRQQQQQQQQRQRQQQQQQQQQQRGGGHVAGARAFGAHLTSQQSSGLNADAAEFVSGIHPPPQSARRRNQPPDPHRDDGDGDGDAKPPTFVTPTPSMADKSTAPDLPTRIHEDIRNRQYECVICTGEVVPSSKVWNCTVCWTVVHLSCVSRWHTSQMNKNMEQQSQDVHSLAWRCPGCNTTLTEEPGLYRCWCGKEVAPRPIAGLPPHSCGQTCSKLGGTCPHPCPLGCHAGPCPPCELMGPSQTCFCGQSTSRQRCVKTDYANGWSCTKTCGDLLPCGEHTCSKRCHGGLCGSCRAPVTVRCYCGKAQKTMPCDQRDEPRESWCSGLGGLKAKIRSASRRAANAETRKPGCEGDASQDPAGVFDGWFECANDCRRDLDCGHHKCTRRCHAQDEQPAHCPLSPDVLSHCSCGKTPLEGLLGHPRRSCTDAIPNCSETCGKRLSCGHSCPDTCHNGTCNRCVEMVDLKCRCGRPFGREVCRDVPSEPPVCERACQAQMSCGRHQCTRRCCPGERKATERVISKRKARAQQSQDDFEAEHICLRVCNKPLKCGSHSCTSTCHKGPCSPCLLSIFEEIACNCGKTVLEPPLACGTKPPECRHPCMRARSCGHPRVEHNCHLDGVPCPKCPFLTEKDCMCGKRRLKNHPCWFEDVRCGLPCGKKLKCGGHTCKKPCHRPGQCEDADIGASHCGQPCGKARKSCEHACVDTCHAPFACKEDSACQSKTLITCACQVRKQEARCGASKSNPHPRSKDMLKCDDECLRLQRNRRLASALNIDPDTHVDHHVPYSDDTLHMYKENMAFAQTYEREFRVFAVDENEKRLRFKPMPSHQRAFLHALAEDYGLDSESQDPEPHRHVSIFKTPRFVAVPRKTIGQCVKIRSTQAQAQAAASATAAKANGAPDEDPYNALLLTGLRFGVTIDEIGAAVAKDLAAHPSMVFITTFLPSEEIVIRATPRPTAHPVVPGGSAVEAALVRLGPSIARDLTRGKLASSVMLCHADASLNITRREGRAGGGAGGGASGGWNAVVSRAAHKMAPTANGGHEGEKATRRYVGLRKKTEVEEAVEEDWLAAAEMQD